MIEIRTGMKVRWPYSLSHPTLDDSYLVGTEADATYQVEHYIDGTGAAAGIYTLLSIDWSTLHRPLRWPRMAGAIASLRRFPQARLLA